MRCDCSGGGERRDWGRDWRGEKRREGYDLRRKGGNGRLDYVREGEGNKWKRKMGMDGWEDGRDRRNEKCKDFEEKKGDWIL